MLQGKGGIYLLDDFLTANDQSNAAHDWIFHYPAFDWYANGKEATVSFVDIYNFFEACYLI